MDTAFTTAQLGLLGGGLVLASIIAGLMAGFLGVGGGIVLVPALFWMFTFVSFPPEVAVHMSVATSLATIIFTSISSARAHHAKGAVDFDLLRVWAVPMGLGALLGGLMSRYFDADLLRGIFGFVALFVALNLAVPKTLVLAERLPASKLVQGGFATFVGGLSALMGIGGGTLSVPILSAFSYPIRRAVGTAAAFGLVIAIPAVLGFIIAGQGVPGRPPLSFGYVSLIAVVIIIPFTTFFAPFGAGLAHRVDGRWVKIGFAVFLSITATRMLWGVFEG